MHFKEPPIPTVSYLVFAVLLVLPCFYPQDNWDLHYHLGGNGPWIHKTSMILTEDVSLPEGCSAEQVHMMSRHAERYPTANAGGRMLDIVKRIKESNVTLKGDLGFLHGWDYFTLST